MKRQKVKTSKDQNEDRPKRPWLRRVGVVVGFLLAGAIINMLVAWSISLLSSYEFKRWSSSTVLYPSIDGNHKISRHGSFGSTQVWTTPERMGKKDTFEFEELQSYARRRLPYWWSMSDYDVLANQLKEWIEIASGAPAHSLKCTHVFDAPIRTRNYIRTDDAISTSFTPHVERIWRLQFNRALPLKPIWPGFLFNTVFYGAIVWMLFATPRAVRRHRRAKKRQCPACGYPVGTSAVCTECGMPVKAVTA